MTPEQLKTSILQYAIQGKLVEQRPEEGTAEELYQQMKQEKQALIKEGKIKKEKPLADINDKEIPYDIPDSWKWVRFNDFGVYKKGPFGSALTKSMFVTKGDNTVKVYEQKNAIQKDATLGDYYITRQYFEEKMSGFEVHPGDVIVSCAGTIGETYILPENIEQGIINQALMRMELMPSVYKEYFLLFFDVVLKETARKSSKGSAIKNIPPFDELKNYLVPLPPLMEQQRIITKINEVFPYIDRYAVAYEKLEHFNARFPEEMKKSILQYAIQGKLVEQRSEEGTAEELYNQIQSGKQMLLQKGQIKKEKPLPQITEDELPFELPENWKWVRVAEICSIINGDRGKNYPAKSTLKKEGIPFISALNLDGKTVKQDANLLCLSDEQYDKLGSGKLVKDDIVVCIRGSLGKHGRYPFEKGAIASSLVICRPFVNDDVLAEYFMLYLDAPLFYSQIRLYDNGTAQPNLSANSFEKFLLPLPPMDEQKRIIEKIKALAPQCERLNK
ncbi:restriction endonuclease subunit S [Butyrivibrio sp. WCE2006]|uniref:restriction endonuclease subunit S n=1 Tax=Butyrivibrio sp. WCE2006 TaxID=1410611 RepID=UPI0005D26C13|nr:restriction endonuclease subunit S [Butyrivibrio sp. WCE2006]